MIEPEDLFSHAVELIRSLDEVDARRAVSSAYYALFHALTRAGAGVFGSAGELAVAQVARAFEHRTMYKVCLSYLDPASRKTTDPRLTTIAQAFVDLQDARRWADYDLASDFAHLDAARLIVNCADVFNALPDLLRGQQGTVFLAKLLLGPRFGRRG